MKLVSMNRLTYDLRPEGMLPGDLQLANGMLMITNPTVTPITGKDTTELEPDADGLIHIKANQSVILDYGLVTPKKAGAFVYFKGWILPALYSTPNVLPEDVTTRVVVTVFALRQISFKPAEFPVYIGLQ